MIAKYAGKCRYCAKPIEVGRDEYDIESKTSFHVDCRDNQPPGPEQFALAEQLRFVDSADVDRIEWTAVCRDWVLRNLRSPNSGATARRPGPDSRERNGLLWE